MKPRVILISREGDAKQTYLNAIKTLEADVDTVSSFGELHRALIQTPYNGVMIDLVTKIRAKKAEKELFHQILELFPVVQLNLEEKSGEIRTLYFGQSVGGGTLEEFVHRECQSFFPRTIRSSLRKRIHFNVTISKNDDFSGIEIEKSVTIDVSEGGCFIYTINEWERQQEVWLRIKELSDGAPILGEVRWRIPWGKTMKLPGIGVQFMQISEEQSDEIYEKCELES